MLASILSASFDDDKAEKFVQIDLRANGQSADYMVVCTGRSSRQVFCNRGKSSRTTMVKDDYGVRPRSKAGKNR